jgi:nicotinamidase/pyrazinamidase
VKNTVLDALALGFQVRVVREGIRAVNVQPGDEDEAFDEMVSAGAEIVNLRDALASLLSTQLSSPQEEKPLA